jgi:AhpC/TSA family
MHFNSSAARRALLVSAMTFAAAVGLGCVGAATAPVVGQPAPAFTGTDTSGQKVSLDQYRGKTVVLEWTNPECPFVQKHYGSGNMQALQKEAASQGVVWISIYSSAPGEQGFVTAAAADRLTHDRGAAPTRVILDPTGAIGHLYNARTTPHMFVIDPAGKLVYMGGIDDKPTTSKSDIQGANNYVRAALKDLAGGRSVATPVSRPYGCSIKYSS